MRDCPLEGQTLTGVPRRDARAPEAQDVLTPAPIRSLVATASDAELKRADVRQNESAPTPSLAKTLVGISRHELRRLRDGDAAAKPAPAKSLERASGARPALFRENALRAKTEEAPLEALPEVGAQRWSLLAVITALVIAMSVVATIGDVEVTSVAPGTVVVRAGPRPVLTEVAGRISEVNARPGERVEAGGRVALIDVVELSARLRHEEHRLGLTRSQRDRVGGTTTRLHEAALRALRNKRALLVRRLELGRATLINDEQQAGQLRALAADGVASQHAALAASNAARATKERELAVEQQIADIDLELSDRRRAFETTMEGLARELEEAEASVVRARRLLDAAEVRAPVAGRVESLLVSAGQVVASGSALAQIVPDGAKTSIVAFAPAKDASFLRLGLRANIEFASLPVSEFGKGKAMVTRVAPDVATQAEVAHALGQSLAEPVIRVELELEPGAELERVRERLRSGERLTARIVTRERRLITLVFDFLRRWYGA